MVIAGDHGDGKSTGGESGRNHWLNYLLGTQVCSSDVPLGNLFEVRNKTPHFRRNEFYFEEDFVSPYRIGGHSSIKNLFKFCPLQ